MYERDQLSSSLKFLINSETEAVLAWTLKDVRRKTAISYLAEIVKKRKHDGSNYVINALTKEKQVLLRAWMKSVK